MEHNGIQIDELALAQGIYDMMDEDAKAIMAFGMVDQRYIDILERGLSEWWETLHRKHFGDDSFPVSQAKKSAFMEAVSNAVTKKLYSVAEMVV